MSIASPHYMREIGIPGREPVCTVTLRRLTFGQRAFLLSIGLARSGALAVAALRLGLVSVDVAPELAATDPSGDGSTGGFRDFDGLDAAIGPTACELIADAVLHEEIWQREARAKNSVWRSASKPRGGAPQTAQSVEAIPSAPESA